MNPASGALHLIDLQSWKDTELPISFENWVAQMAFSPDGRSLAITYAGPTTPEHGMPRTYFLSVIDLSKQAIAGTADLGFTPRTLNISADGRWLAVYGARQDPATALTDGFPRLVLLDARDLSVAWEAPLNSVLDGQYRVASEDHPYISWSPAVVLSADGSKLYVVHADQDSLTTVDLAARTVTTVKIGPRLSLLNQLMGFGAGVAHAKGSDGTTKQAVLSPDGAQLFVTGQVTRLVQHTDGLQMDETPLGLQVVEAATGVELQRVETKATQVAIAPDGSQLYLIGQAQLGWPWTDVLDTQSLEAVGHLNGWRVTPARLPDGRLILLANADPTTTVSVIDGATLKEMNRWVDSGWVEWIVKP